MSKQFLQHGAGETGSASVAGGSLSELIGEAALIVAHPDDEILWFSSIYKAVKQIFVCYLDVPEHDSWTAGRRAVAAEYPMANVDFLGLTEAVAIYGSDWERPSITEEGLELSKRPGTLPGYDPDLYKANYHRLLALLEHRLNGFSTVVTHNPWGEYGHEEHVQVYRAVSSLSRDMGYDVWYSNYCSNRSYKLMLQTLSGFRSNAEAFPTQPEAVKPIEDLYRQHDCWTWSFDDYRYFPQECFIPDRPVDKKADMGSTLPLNFVKVEDLAQKSWLTTWRKRVRKAKRRIKSWSHME